MFILTTQEEVTITVTATKGTESVTKDVVIIIGYKIKIFKLFHDIKFLKTDN